MKDEFIKKLEDDEKILVYSIANVEKTSKQSLRFILIMIFLIFFWIMLINSNSFGIFDIMKKEMFYIILILLTLLILIGYLYNLFFKYKSKNNEYFVTNKRIAIYNCKKGFVIRNISDIERIEVSREKNNYGDIGFVFNGNSLFEQMKNMISFEGIENPRMIIQAICDINSNIHIYDDKPTLFGKKI